MADHSGMKLGKLPPRPIASLKPIRHYLLTTSAKIMPPVPTSCDRSGSVASWGSLLNDQIGDCTIAAVGHAVQLWTAIAGDMRAMSDAEAVQDYELFGYRPGDEATDQGAVASDVLTRWNGAGLACGGVTDTLTGFCAINQAEAAEVRQGVAWLGVVYGGFDLPIAAQQMDVWDAPATAAGLIGDYAPGSWGGHAVPIIGYGPNGVTCVTWGALKQITWRFWNAYADEAFGLLSRDFVTATGSAGAVDWPMLEADMADLKSEVPSIS